MKLLLCVLLLVPLIASAQVYRWTDKAAATGGSAPACTYASQSYSHGSVSCQDRSQFRCDNGIWSRTANAC